MEAQDPPDGRFNHRRVLNADVIEVFGPCLDVRFVSEAAGRPPEKFELAFLDYVFRQGQGF